MFVFSTNPGTVQTVPANWAQTVATCEMIFKCEVYDGFLTGVSGLNQISLATTSSWIEVPNLGSGSGHLAWAKGFTNGALAVETTTTYDPYQDFAVKVTYTSKYS